MYYNLLRQWGKVMIKDMEISKVLEELEKIDVTRLTCDMVGIPSYSFMEEQEKEISAYISRFFDAEGIECRRIEIEPGRYNVYASIKGGSGRSLMLSGHMDTVPPYDMEKPFKPIVRGGEIFGRGSVDMKGPLASMMAAMAAIKRSGVIPAGDVIFAGLADEEEAGKGAKHLAEQGPRTDGVIMGEPTSLNIDIGHKGLEWIEITVHGKKTHGGNKAAGINAIQMAARLINKIYDEYVPVLNSRVYPVLGVPTINLGTIKGGDQPSTVAGECVLTLDRRCVPTETIEQVYEELEALIGELHSEDPAFSATVKDVFDGVDMMRHEPFCTPENDSLVVTLREAVSEFAGEPVVSAFPAWSDAGFLKRADNGCVVMGPGELGLAHTAGEHVGEESLRTAARIYAATAVKYGKNN